MHTKTTVVIATINDEKLEKLKFGESANKSVQWKKVWQNHPELQVCIYGYYTNLWNWWIKFGENSMICQICQTVVPSIFVVYSM